MSFLRINPLSFIEFLRARGRLELADVLEGGAWDVVAALHQRCLASLAEYMVVGGMPEVVATFVESSDFA